jgi:mono/diheme cytochrome c family protein
LKFLIILSLFTLFTHAENNENTSTLQEDNLTIETQESFLSSVEYGRVLYQSPRGISCSQCHGKEGKGGQIIAKYYDKRKNPKLLKGVNITSYSLKNLEASLKDEYREDNKRKPHKIMPMYYLTDEEVQAIFNYLQYSNKQKK